MLPNLIFQVQKDKIYWYTSLIFALGENIIKTLAAYDLDPLIDFRVAISLLLRRL